jgi:NADPH2:quinone reductase
VAGDGQVVVDVRAAGVNYVDALFVAGDYQIKPSLPFVPGSEIAGTVVEVGPGVEGVAPGDRVLAMPGLGGFADRLVISAAQLVAVPETVSFTQAATFVQSYCTALYALRTRASLVAGETVLVLGAGGGVGLATIDVATALGATALAAASTADKRAAALAMGASAAIDSEVDDLKARARELGGGGVDVVVDPVGAELAEPALRALRWFGRYVVIGFAGGPIPRLPLNQVLLNNRTIVGVDWGAWAMRTPDAQHDLLTELLSMAAAGRLHPVEPTTYPLDRAADALDDLLGRRVVGKVALVSD